MPVLADKSSDGPDDPTPVWVTVVDHVRPAVFEIVDPYSKLEGLLVSGWIRGRRDVTLGMSDERRAKLARCLANPTSDFDVEVLKPNPTSKSKK